MAHVREVQRKSGIAFEIRWRENGVDRQATRKTRRLAERFALKVENDIAEGKPTERVRRETVAEIVEKVLAIDERKLKPTTLLGSRRIYAVRILPKWGKRRVATITSQEIEAWVAELAEKRAPATVRHYHLALSKVMKYALKHELINKNPCVGIDLPERKKGNDHATFLKPEEVAAIAASLPEPYGLLVRFAAATGLRAAEVAGLRILDVNPLRREIRVEQTLKRINGEVVLGTPKSAKSTRTVPLLDSGLVKELTAFLESHPNPLGLLFPGRGQGGNYELDYGKPFNHASFYGWYWRPALVRAGIKPLDQLIPSGDHYRVGCCKLEYFTEEEAVRHIARHVKGGPRFHDLRHTAASTWLDATIDMLKVSRWMGHSSIKITLDVYGHLLPGDYADSIAKLEAWYEQRADQASPVVPIRKEARQ